MRFYRIKQIAEDCYIPQVKKGILGSWDGIDGELFEAWYSAEYQIRHCSVKTIEAARKRIAEHKKKLRDKKKFPKYFKA